MLDFICISSVTKFLQAPLQALKALKVFLEALEAPLQPTLEEAGRQIKS